jgi:DNA-binding transcriptional MerR regulator
MADKARGAPAVKVYTRKELEQATGVSSTTIHFYLRSGLLPRPQKTSYSRSLYTDEHLNILKKIVGLKQQGLSLAEIETEVGDMIQRANRNKIDVVGQERERLRNRILAVATKEFAAKGYNKTHVTTIIRRVPITPSLLYSYFSGKRILLLECVRVLMSWSLKYVDSKQTETSDSAKRVLWLIFGHGNVFKLGSAALSLARVEGAQSDRELRRPLQQLFDNVIEHYTNELRGVAGSDKGESRPIPKELLAHSLFGAHEQTMFRQQADKKYSRKDAFMTHLWLFLAVQAAWSGEVDIDSRVRQYESFVSELASRMPPMPPELED